MKFDSYILLLLCITGTDPDRAPAGVKVNGVFAGAWGLSSLEQDWAVELKKTN